MKALLVDLLPYEHSTRTRKLGSTLQGAGLDVSAITLSRVGRMGIAGDPQSGTIDRVSVEKIHAPKPYQGSSSVTAVANLLRTYPQPILQLARRALNSPADVFVVGHMSLVWLGLMHQRKFGSRIVLNGRERPGGIRTSGSLGTVFSRLEPSILSRLPKGPDLAVVAVCESHAADFRKFGLSQVFSIRNVPRSDFRPPYTQTPGEAEELVVAYVGSLYEGRGLAPLMDAVAEARAQGLPVRLEITGRGGEGFVREIKARTALCSGIDYLGPCSQREVPERYQRAHIGTALYEMVDTANDSLSNKIFECCASGRPVLAGNLPENSDLVARHELGWVSEVTSEALLKTLREIFSECATLENMARSVYSTAEREFYWEHEVEPLMNWIFTSNGRQA